MDKLPPWADAVLVPLISLLLAAALSALVILGRSLHMARSKADGGTDDKTCDRTQTKTKTKTKTNT